MLIESKSIFAKLLASENIDVVFGPFETASFYLNTRQLRLPIWSDAECTDMLVGHEVSHALNTPLDAWKAAIESGMSKDLINVVEDVRIERLIQKRFPGLKRDFIRGYVRLMELDFFEFKGETVFPMSDKGFLDRINIKAKCRNHVEVEFSVEEKALFDMCYKTVTFGDVIEVCKLIEAYIKDKKEKSTDNKDQSPDKGTESKSSDAGEETSGDTKKGDTEEETDGFEEEYYTVTGNGPSDEEYTDEESRGAGAERATDVANAGDLTSESQRAMDKNVIDKLVTDNSGNVGPACKAMTKEQRAYIINEYEDSEIGVYAIDKAKSFMSENKSIVNSMVKEFEIRKKADQYRKAKPTQTGQLDTNKLHEYRYNDEIFLRGMKIPNGKSHGMCMLIDNSGSMDKVIEKVRKQAVTLAMFCRKANIPFAVYTFTSYYSVNEYPAREDFQMDCSQITVNEVLNSTMKNDTFVRAVANLINRRGMMGGTPMLESLIALQPIVKSIKEINNLDVMNLVVLADGSPQTISMHQSMRRTEYHRTSRVWLDKKTCMTMENDKHAYVMVKKAMSDVYDWYRKTGAADHIISFFIADSGMCYSRDLKPSAKPITTHNTDNGYDTEILIPYRSAALKNETDELNIEEGASNRKIAGAFKRQGSSKKNTRIIVKEFAEAIS